MNYNHIVTYSLKEGNVEPGKQPLLSNGYITGNNGVSVGSGVCCAVKAEPIYRGKARIM
jgi:hypothetical protein